MEGETVAGLDGEGGSDKESKSWGRRERITTLNDVVSDGRKPVMIFVGSDFGLSPISF